MRGQEAGVREEEEVDGIKSRRRKRKKKREGDKQPQLDRTSTTHTDPFIPREAVALERDAI